MLNIHQLGLKWTCNVLLEMDIERLDIDQMGPDINNSEMSTIEHGILEIGRVELEMQGLAPTGYTRSELRYRLKSDIQGLEL